MHADLIHPAVSQRIHLYPIEIETDNHEFFLPRIRYGTGTTGKYRRFASTAVVPRYLRCLLSLIEDFIPGRPGSNTKTIDPSCRSALVSASSSELLKKYYVKKVKSKT
eukprot:SAG11_NODE_361_length_10183_cov_4.077053_1_plen_107_part_10